MSTTTLREPRFRLSRKPLSRYRGLPLKLAKLVPYLDRQWSETDAEQVRAYLDAWQEGEFPEEFDEEGYLEEFGYPLLFERLAELLQSYDKIKQHYETIARVEREKQAVENFLRLTRLLNQKKTLYLGRAAIRYKGVTWQRRYMDENWYSTEEYKSLMQERATEKDALPAGFPYWQHSV